MGFTRIFQAIEFAADKHSAQRRKSGNAVPYINHPIMVARLLAEVGGVEDENVLMAAVLHDTLEDTETTSAELTAAFGANVCGWVEEVTDDKSLPKAERKRLQIVHAPSLTPQAALIKLGDKISNVHDISHAIPVDWSIERARAYVDWAEEVVKALPDVNPALKARFAETAQAAREALARAG